MQRHIPLQMLSAVVGLVSAVILQIALARILGPQSFGIYGVALSTQHFAMIGQDGGFRTLLMRESAKPSDNPAFAADTLIGRALGLNFVVTLPVLVIAILILGLDLWQAVLFAILGASAKVVTGFVSGTLIGRQAFDREAKWQILGKLATAAAGIAAAFATDSAVWVLAAIFLVQSLMLLPALHGVAFTAPRIGINREILAFTGKLTLLAFMTALYFRVGPMLLYVMGKGLDEVSYFALLHRMLDALLFLIAPLTQFAFVHARVGNSSTVSPARGALIAAVWVGAGIFFSTLAFIYGNDIVALVAGEDYRPAGILGGWFGFAFLFAGPNFLMMQVLLAHGRENTVLISSATAVSVGLVLNLALIPIFGAAGAAASIVGSELVQCATLFALGRRYLLSGTEPVSTGAH